MDIYTDFFNSTELLRTLSQVPYTPGQLGAAGIFKPVPLSGTTFAVEETPKNSGRVLTAMPRGAPRQTMGQDKRKVHSFSVTDQYGDQGSVWADEVLNARAAMPSARKEIIEQRRAEQMARMRRTVDLTHEYLRMSALLSPASADFGAAASGVVIAVQTDATKTRKEIFDKVRIPMNAALDGAAYNGIIVFCSDGYWSDLMGNKEFRESYVNWEAATSLRAGIGAGGQNTTPPMPYGDALWQWYRGTSTCKIPDNEARAVPLGTDDFAWQPYAPNTTMESVGSGGLGQPYYVGAKPITDSQGTLGWEMSIQSHTRCIVGRPAAIIPITKS